MKRIILLLFIGIVFLSKSYSQEYYQLEETFLDADSWFFYEDYKEALPLFLKVLESDSLNYNVMYKIGYCYLNIPGQKAKSIPYLENAIKKTTPNYRNNNYAEKLAPVDALFYLGNAYLVNNRIDEAIDAYTGFQNAITRTKKLANKDIYDTDYLTRQFDACRNAIQFEYKPISFIASNIGSKINTRFNEFNAVVSGDGKTLVFTASLQFYDAIFYSKKVNGEWSYPINLMGQLGVDDKSATTGLSFDGTELYIYRDDDFDGNIYVSYLKNGIWSRVKKLGPNINTKYWESHASVSPDNKKLYFVSNREGGYGDLDIYVSERAADSTWGVPQNLGDKINTRWNENTPFLTPDGKRLFFSSEGHQGMGGYDIYYSTLENGKWSDPVNIGYPINTTDDDIFFVPFEKGSFAYCSQFSKKGFGGQDIYHFQLFNIPDYGSLTIEGVLTMDNKKVRNKKDFKINIIDKNTQDTVVVLNPDIDKQTYQYRTPLGKNHLVYESSLEDESGKQYFISTDYNIREVFQSELEKQRLAQLEKEKSRPEIISTQNNYIVDSDNENVRIKLSLQKGNKLYVNTFYKDKLINSEEFDIKNEDFIYQFKPLVGESTIQFKLIDKNNHEKNQEITVSYIPKDVLAELNIEGKTITLDENGNKNVKIKLKVEKDSKLIVETFVDGKLINTETFDINQESFVYEYQPKGNKSKLNFKLVDKYNNVKNEEVLISHTPISQELASTFNQIKTFDNKGFENIIKLDDLANAGSVENLLNLLYEKAAKAGLSNEQTQALIIALAINLTDNTPQFIADLQKLAEGDLKTVLDSALINQKDFKSNLAVVQYLELKANSYNYNHRDIIRLLEKYLKSSNIGVDQMIAILENLLKTDITNVLANLDISAIDIVTIDDFRKYLESKNIYSENELKNIFALIEGMRIASKASEESDIIRDNTIASKETGKKRHGITLLYIFISGIFLTIFIIYFKRRRNKANKKREL